MPDVASGTEVTEVAPAVHRLALPLGIHGVPTVSAYLLHGDGGDVLVDCGVAASGPPHPGSSGAEPDPCGALDAALRVAGSRIEQVATLVVTHAHIDHFGLAGEVVRRSGGQLWMHEATGLDVEKYRDPDEAVDRRMLMLADHGLYGRELTESSEGLYDWMPAMPSIGTPDRRLVGGELVDVGDRSWEVVHTPGHSPGHVCLFSATDRVLCSGDHLLQITSPPVTFERGFARDPMGDYLESLERVVALEPELVLPGHGPPFRDGARRAASIARGKRRRLDRVRAMVTESERTVAELTEALFHIEMTGAQRHFAMAEILADLAFHEARGILERTRAPDGTFRWRPTSDDEQREATR
jgi:glyoxylase-like metal-dependent hydrolase (beta-lactamase superfamily II)